MLLLQDKVSNTCLLMNFIDQAMELVKQLLLLSFEVLELLQSHFVLPLDLLRGTFKLGDALLGFSEFFHDDIVLLLRFKKLANFFVGLSQRLNDLVVSLLLVHLFLLSI
mgnify:CR=1 FL=1